MSGSCGWWSNNLDDYSSEWAAITSVSSKLGMTPETLRVWVRRAQIDGGLRPGLTTDERKRLKEPKKEVCDLRRANEILKDASILVLTARLCRLPARTMAFNLFGAGGRWRTTCAPNWSKQRRTRSAG